MLEHRGEVYVGTSFISPCSQSCAGVVISNGTLLFVCGEQCIVLITADCLGTSKGPLWSAIDSILVLKASIGEKKWPVEILSHLLIVNVI